MKRFLKFVSFVLLVMSTSGNTFAEEKVNIVRQGTIRGRIVDTSKQTLPGASIYIEKLHTGVTSDVNGYYTFANLTPGTYTIKVSYVGYSPVEMKITIPAGKTLEKDVVLNEGLELQEVVVGGAFQGQRRAINSQKNKLGITNVVSADEVGKFPDSNIGDALKRINGINVQYDQGEARFGQVRGTSADLSSVTINGNRLPSAEGDTRNVQLDLILDAFFEERRDRFGVGDVKAKGTGFPARRHNVPGHGFSFISLADIGEIHLISGLRQRLRNGLADTSGAAGHEGGGKLFAHVSHLNAVFSCL